MAWGSKRSNPEGKKLLNYATKLDLQIHAPEEPTHFHHLTPDILDIAVSKNLALDLVISSSDSLSSDHNPIKILLNEHYIHNPLQPLTFMDWDVLSHDLSEITIPNSQITAFTRPLPASQTYQQAIPEK
ncbi:hypothetical protein YQE_06040, partial [Dendroctonus ponderosae]